MVDENWDTTFIINFFKAYVIKKINNYNIESHLRDQCNQILDQPLDHASVQKNRSYFMCYLLF